MEAGFSMGNFVFLFPVLTFPTPHPFKHISLTTWDSEESNCSKMARTFILSSYNNSTSGCVAWCLEVMAQTIPLYWEMLIPEVDAVMKVL